MLNIVTMTIAKDANNDNTEEIRATLLCLPQCDVERPANGVSQTGSTGIGVGNIIGKGNDRNKNNSMKTTTKRADLVLFEMPKCKKGDYRKDLLEGRCKILANGQYASLVTPSTSLKLVTVGTSNALIVWNKDDVNPGEEHLKKRRKTDTTIKTTTTTMVGPSRLIQPGGSGSSFLVGQPRDLDPMELSQFFEKRQAGRPDGDATTIASISTKELCNKFQVAPNEIWEAMLWIPSVVSNYEDINSISKEGKEREESWQLVPEEDVLFGQRALLETLCEDDDESTTTTVETMAVKVSRRLLPLLLDRGAPETGNSNAEKEDRCLAIARKTVLLSSSSSYSTKTEKKLNDFNRPFEPDASRIAFYALRDLFLKCPTYSWSDLSNQWSTRLPLGEKYESITSTTEWIEDEKIGGHGGLVPNQLVFSSSAPSLVGRGGSGDGNYSSKDDVKNHDSSTSKLNDVGNCKSFLSLVDPQAVLVWMGRKN